MTSAGHRSHGKLPAPARGMWSRRECAVYGTTCEEVLRFVQWMSHSLPDVPMAYVDEDHKVQESPDAGFLHWTGQSGHASVQGLDARSKVSTAAVLDGSVTWVNGNHHAAEKQLIIVHPEKEASLRKRAEQLTQVMAIVLPEKHTEVPAYIREVTAGKEIPVIRMASPSAARQLTDLLFPPPVLRALVLTGGKSERMGTDKSRMNYHGQPQYLYIASELQSLGLQVVISCRREQEAEYAEAGLATFTDRVEGIGPLGGILTALLEDPASAWLVVATDMPGWNREAAKQLIRSRNHFVVATAFQDLKGLPEPLTAIWEPTARMHVFQSIGAGIHCPRKVLIQSNARLIAPDKQEYITNVNTPQEAEEVRSVLRTGISG